MELPRRHPRVRLREDDVPMAPVGNHRNASTWALRTYCPNQHEPNQGHHRGREHQFLGSRQKQLHISIAPIPHGRERRSAPLSAEFTKTPVLALLSGIPAKSSRTRRLNTREVDTRIVTHARLRSRLRRSCAHEAGSTSRRIRRIRRGIGSMQDCGKSAAGDERGDRFNLSRQRAILGDSCRRSPYRGVGFSGECSGL